jgi:heavy metal sensor kinase
MLRRLKSIRAKLTLWYSLILLSTLTAFGVIGYIYSRQQLTENLDRSLKNEVRWVKNFIDQKAAKVKPSRKFVSKKKHTAAPVTRDIPADENTDDSGDADDEIWNQIYQHILLNPKKTLIEVNDLRGAVIFRSPVVTDTANEQSIVVKDPPFRTTMLTTIEGDHGEQLRVAATTTENARIFAAYPLEELQEVLDNLFSIFLILVPLALTVSIGGGWFLAHKSLRPVDEVTTAARQITAKDLNTRIPQHPVDDEIGRLISTFNDMIARLRQSFEQVRQFSVDASHELRTPMTIMRGEVELALRNPKTPEEYRRILVSNLEEIVRLSAIIDNLLTLSKAEMGHHDIRFDDRVDVHDLIAELYEDSEIIAMKKQIAIVLDKNEDVTIRGDRLRLRQLFLNLIDNAIKYTPENGTITISSGVSGNNVCVSVKDNGIGIPEEEQAKVFDRFYRVDKGRSREMGGSGLGLSIAKWTAELHRGRIDVESQPGNGSTFTVTLPLSVADPVPAV